MKTNQSRVGKYTIIRTIAQGGMGRIFKAHHPTLQRPIILKRLTLVGNHVITRRFQREAELMMDFHEDRIVQVYDHFKEGAAWFIAMEFVNGVSLAELIAHHRYLPNQIALMIFLEVARGLHYAHEKGVIHRDIKPENILISRQGEVKLTDFGIAVSRTRPAEDLTRNMTLGTPAYMSPEQIQDSSAVDRRSDIYSMGVLLYKMVTGRSPFPGTMTPETIARITRGEYSPPRKINPRISSWMQQLIRKSMHRDRQRRFQDLAVLINKLERRLGRSRESSRIQSSLKDFIHGRNPAATRRSTGAVRGQGLPARAASFAAWLYSKRRWSVLFMAGLLFSVYLFVIQLTAVHVHAVRLQEAMLVPANSAGQNPGFVEYIRGRITP
ncbi:MAG: serine/threonine protein kinase [Leptospiraceae bacterium]|nr:serine/threonine protein kinase [Leptospiraceae bacterium]